jgi:poly-gamma-glutamate capsule biosynthesis protein CapA/YwtB (metallophosphatase superfamily)
MKAHGTRERIIKRNKYNPSDPKKAERETREHNGKIQTHKKKGDLVIVNPHVKSMKVDDNGWF